MSSDAEGIAQVDRDNWDGMAEMKDSGSKCRKQRGKKARPVRKNDLKDTPSVPVGVLKRVQNEKVVLGSAQTFQGFDVSNRTE